MKSRVFGCRVGGPLTKKPSRFQICLAAIALSGPLLRAQTTWQAGGDSNWSTAATWSGGALANDGTAWVVFSSAGSTTPNIDAPWSIAELTFDSDTQSYAISGSTLTLGSSGLTVVSAAQVISAPLTIETATTVSVIAGASISLSGIIGGGGGLSKTDGGMLTLSGANTYTGNTTISGGGGAEELYDLRADPDCLRNLVAEPARTATKTALRKQLHAELTAQGDPRMRGEGDVFDRYPVAPPAMRGFYEKFLRGEAPRTTWVEESDYEKTPIPARRPTP